MSRKKTHEEFVEELKLCNKNFDDIELISEYTGIKNKIECKCKKCGNKWITTANVLKIGCGCPSCGQERVGKSQRRSLDDFLDKLYSIRDDIEYINGYVSMKNTAVFRCKKHNELFTTTPQNALKKVSCSLCRKEKPRYNKLSKNQINDSLSHIRIEIVGEYINSKTPTVFKCQLCGNEFVSKYEIVKYRKTIGCNKCGNIIDTTKRSEILNRRIENMYSQKSDNVKILEYDENCQQIKCKCLICNEVYKTSYDSLTQGCMHKKCASIKALSKFRLSKDEVNNRVKSFGNNILINFDNYISSESLLDCECLDCGNKWTAKQKNLIRGRGCPVCAQKRRDISKYKSIDDYKSLLDEMNLSIISEYINATTPVTIKCNTCGNVFESTMSYISNFHIGCKRCSQYEYNLQKLDKFVFKLSMINSTIKLIGDFVNMSTNTDFLCTECNRIFTRTPHDLLKSCNCPNCTTNSKIEYYIMKYLRGNNILYDLHKTYPDLKGVNDGLLSYDFYLPQYNILIEGQGVQHEKPIEYFGGEYQFKIQQEHDDRKRNYAKEHNIELLEIWYYDFDNIEQILSKKLNISSNKKLA